jgi:hypothetical protein
MGMAECYRLRAELRPLAIDRRSADCGNRAIHPTPKLKVRRYGVDGSARCDCFMVGVLKCNRQWACPVCAAKKAAKRAEEIGRVLLGAHECFAQMVTLTVPHAFGESLASVLERVYCGFRSVRTLRGIKDIFASRVAGTLRAFEVTHGKNGWHAHIHLLLLLRTPWFATEQKEFEEEFLRRVPGAKQGIAVAWSKRTLASTAQAGGLYLTKLGAELSGIGKTPKNGNRTPWQIAALAIESPRARMLWREYQRTMKGRRILVLDARAKALAERAPKAEEPTQEFVCDMWAEEVAAVGAFEKWVPGIWWELFEACKSGPDPPKQFRSALDDVLEWRPRSQKAA